LRSPHLLFAGSNARRLKQNLVGILNAASIDAIEQEISRNAAQLYKLGKNHYLFAKRQSNRAWRQKISRLYYGAYNVSRSIRFCVNGEFSTDSTDHKKIDAIPPDFPHRNSYANRLGVLRDDRNLCDYDHTAVRRDLVLGVDDSLQLVTEFLRDARGFLIVRGVKL